jgi:hypothetical protein
MPDAGDRFGAILGAPPRHSRADVASEAYLATRDFYVNVGSVDARVLRQPITDILSNTLVGAGVAARAASAMIVLIVALATVLGVFVAKPRLNLVAGAIPKAAIIVAVLTIRALAISAGASAITIAACDGAAATALSTRACAGILALLTAALATPFRPVVAGAAVFAAPGALPPAAVFAFAAAPATAPAIFIATTPACVLLRSKITRAKRRRPPFFPASVTV